ncbi:hypothetical protein AQUCO_00700100v1 [Aquilegia coerulea]|uniref:Cytochrome P450 n=1 Tax=Aquilegia coerulea TaxID=218851 RepID=A0A2G5EIP3_AQUCA|nr:hypothetical protein AQUCO_00700100v1 [Aquilegia coerulea]
MSSTSDKSSQEPQLPIREIPGDYGLPVIGPIKDHLDYFYNQGEIEFFRSREKKYASTVFRVNMPPGPFIASDSKKDVLDGTFMPVTSFFGGYRPCAFLDPSETKHARLKQLFFSLLASFHGKFILTFQTSLSEIILITWLTLQVAPLGTLGLTTLSKYVEDLLIHTFKLPFFPVKTAGFNVLGGMIRLFLALIKWIGLAGPKLHKQLADEIRDVISTEGGLLTFSTLEKMPLTKWVVYEAIRLGPPIPYQYGKAKEDLTVQNHESTFEIKKDRMIFGGNNNEFVVDRFVGEEGDKLLQYVCWSNGRETDNSTLENKQCPTKDLVVLLSRLMVAELFLRYDTFMVEAVTTILGSIITITSTTKACKKQ